MKRKFSYSIGEMNRRLLAIGKIHPWLSGDFDAFKYHWCTSAYGSNGLWCIVGFLPPQAFAATLPCMEY